MGGGDGLADRIKTKPPRVFCFRGGKFFVRVNDRFSGSSRDHGWDGIIWTDFTFPGSFLPLASSKFFGFGLQYVSRFRKRYLHYSLQIPVNRFSSDGRISLGFQGSMDLGFSDLGALRVFPGFSDCTTVFQVFGSILFLRI